MQMVFKAGFTVIATYSTLVRTNTHRDCIVSMSIVQYLKYSQGVIQQNIITPGSEPKPMSMGNADIPIHVVYKHPVETSHNYTANILCRQLVS